MYERVQQYRKLMSSWMEFFKLNKPNKNIEFLILPLWVPKKVFQNFPLKYLQWLEGRTNEKCLVCFPVDVMKYFDKSNLRKNRFIGSQFQVLHLSLQGNQGVKNLKQQIPLHSHSRVENNACRQANAQLTLPILYSLGTPAQFLAHN